MFGSASIGIHIPQCQTKTVARWANNPSKERGPPPPVASMSAASIAATVARGRAGSAAAGAGRGSASGLPSIEKPVRGLGGGGAADFGGPAAFAPGALDLVACRYCGRRFNSDRVGKHENACTSARGSRAQFDARAQRLRDLMDEMGAPPVRGGRRPMGGAANTLKGGATLALRQTTQRYAGAASDARYASLAPKRDWRREHEDLISAVRSARQYAAQEKRSTGGYGSTAVRGRAPSVGRAGAGGGGGYPGMARMGGGGGASSAMGGGFAPGRLPANLTRGTPNTAVSRAPGTLGGGIRPSSRGPTTSSAYGGGRASPGYGGGSMSSHATTSRFGGGASAGGGGGYGRPTAGGRILQTNETSAGMWGALGR
jgi:hypothetical protein